jgi:hypothetical protein
MDAREGSRPTSPEGCAFPEVLHRRVPRNQLLKIPRMLQRDASEHGALEIPHEQE